MNIAQKAERIKAIAYNRMGVLEVEEAGRNLAVEKSQLADLLGTNHEAWRGVEMMYADIENVRVALLHMLAQKEHDLGAIAHRMTSAP